MVTSSGARANAFAADSPPNPAPTMTIRGRAEPDFATVVAGFEMEPSQRVCNTRVIETGDGRHRAYIQKCPGLDGEDR